ncbi:MAG: isoprenylcysteine carboxylmethyltransferase family protein [Gammaproteobacteria bacterium]|nr:isoprenylcysteine carboxylmethyltransferase family protein [Gammaproteobacteria bacterium]
MVVIKPEASFNAYIILLGLYILSIYLAPNRQLQETDRQPDGEDQFFFFAAFLFLAWWAALLMPIFTNPHLFLPVKPAIYVGAILFFVGAGTRALAIRTLGQSFTYILCIRPDHRLVTNGIYRLIRHPGYTGPILECVGILVAARSVYGLMLFIPAAVILYTLRIQREEKMMLEHFGEEYARYQQSTKRLLPWIY